MLFLPRPIILPFSERAFRSVRICCGWLLLTMTLFLLGCAAPGEKSSQEEVQRYEYTQLHMGMQVRLVLYADREDRAREAARAAFNRIAVLDSTLSHYQADSELSRLNEQAGGPPVAVSDDLFNVLEYALTISERSGGAFDVTVGPLVDLWQSSAERGMLPDEGALEQTRTRVGWEYIRLDPDERTVQLLAPGMELDLGGLAKGYILDESMDILRERRIDQALIEAGGDIVVSEAPPGTEGWRIQVPYYPEPDSMDLLVLTDVAISTSGDTEQYVLINETRYSHVIDPRTGLGLTDQVLATVVAPSGLQADALATTASILGREEGREFLTSYPKAEGFLRPSPWTRQAEQAKEPF